MNVFIFYTQATDGKTRLLFYVCIALVFFILSPTTCPADERRILDENRGSVVIVYAYDREGRQIDHASGFIVSKDGAVATNYRIVSSAAEIKIKTEDSLMEVKGLLYSDRENDLAILKIEDKNFPAVKIRDTLAGTEGRKMYLIGSPQGEDKIIFEGTLSRIRDIASGKKLLLITTPVTKGGSGGPVLDENGEVIGIATYIMEEAQPYYFAMPVASIKDKLPLKKITPLSKANLIAYEKTAERWSNLGSAYESLALYSLASGAYQESLKINPDDAIAHNNLGLIYTSLGIYSFAIREHLEAIRLAPAFQEAYFNLGIAYSKSRNDQKALETFEKAITLKPDDAASYNNLASACFKSGKYKEAIEASKKALSINPDYAEAYYNLGVSCFKLNRIDDATEALRQSIRLKPNIPEAHFGLAVIYSMRDIPSALKEYDILKNLDPGGANALHEILEAKKVNPSETRGPYPYTEKKETRQPETTVAAQKDKITPVPVAPPPKEVPLPSLSSLPQEKISPAPATASPEKEEKKTRQPETTVVFQKDKITPVPVASPPKEVPLPSLSSVPPEKISSVPTTASSERETASSVDANRSVKTAEPETLMKSDRALNKDTYSVQVGVLGSEQGAHALTSRLKKKQYDVFIKTEQRKDKNTRYRILVGRFSEKSEAIKLAGTILKNEKMESIIYRH